MKKYLFLFFDFHNETLRPYDQRVKSLIFYRTEENWGKDIVRD